jgi:hypothetical protein
MLQIKLSQPKRCLCGNINLYLYKESVTHFGLKALTKLISTKQTVNTTKQEQEKPKNINYLLGGSPPEAARGAHAPPQEVPQTAAVHQKPMISTIHGQNKWYVVITRHTDQKPPKCGMTTRLPPGLKTAVKSSCSTKK